MKDIAIYLKELDHALNYDLTRNMSFRLYNQANNRTSKFIFYDGKNYNDLVAFLFDGCDSVYIPLEEWFQTGLLYTVNADGCCISVDPAEVDAYIALNSRMVKTAGSYCMLFNLAVAKWLLQNYPDVHLQNIFSVFPLPCCKSTFSSVNQLNALPAASILRTHKVWLLPMSCKTHRIDVHSIPDEVLTSDYASPEVDHLFEVVDAAGLKGIRVVSKKSPFLNPVYENVKIVDCLAYLQNDSGKWAEYNLLTNRFETDFIYDAIEISSLSNRIKATRNSKTELIHPKPQPQRLVVACKDNLYGLEDAQGNSIVPCVYDSFCLTGNYYLIQKDGKSGLLSSKGQEIFPCIYDEIYFPHSYSKLVYICLDDQWALFDIEGNQLSTFSGRYPDEEQVNLAIDDYIRKSFDFCKPLDTFVKIINKKKCFTYLTLKGLNREVWVGRMNMPVEIYDANTSHYTVAIRFFRKSMILINKYGHTVYSYKAKRKMDKYLQNIQGLENKCVYDAYIYRIIKDIAIVSLSTGYCTSVKIEGIDCHVGDKIRCKAFIDPEVLKFHFEFVEMIEDTEL